MKHQAKKREPTVYRLMPLLALVLAAMLAVPAFADRVSVVDPHTGKRHQLPDHNRDGRADYVPRYLGIDVNPGLVIPENRARRERSSGGTICHGNDGGTTISTARRACDPGAPAGDGGRAESRSSTVPNSSATPTRPSRSSSTQLN